MKKIDISISYYIGTHIALNLYSNFKKAELVFLGKELGKDNAREQETLFLSSGSAAAPISALPRNWKPHENPQGWSLL
jgi:hypothetical protein